MLIVHIVYLMFLWFDSTRAQSSSLWPSWIPLAVRSPFLNCWMATKDVPFNSTNARAPIIWPLFMQDRILGWAGLIRIDDRDTYIWLGTPGLPAPLGRSILTNIQVTPTTTILSITAGKVDLNVTFLSPIETSDPVLQSLTLSYVSLVASSNDGLPHHVQVYSDISGEWLSGDSNDMMTWSTRVTNTTVFHQLDLQNSVPFSVKSGQSEDASLWYAMLNTVEAPSVTYMADSDANCRTRFNVTGTLTNGVNTPPKVISDHFNVFAISADLGSVTTQTNPVVWTVGLTRNPAIQYQTPNSSLESRIPYWATKFTTAQDAVGAFVADFPNALQRATALDERILSNASAVSSAYADLISLAARQAMAGTELTVSPNGDGTDIKMFMQDTGASGPNRRVNPVEVMYASFPFFLYLNASYGGYLLEPVLEYANYSAWRLPYPPRDIGLLFPNATGNQASHSQGVEQSGNMLIMALAHARASGDGTLLSNYYGLFRQWAEYLVNHTWPLDGTQTSADAAEARANLTNLAVKGIIGLQAMSEIGHTLQRENDTQRYAGIAAQYASSWITSALASDGHVLSNFGDPDSSWTIAYNLFADRLLQTNVIDQGVYRAQSAFVQALSTTSPRGVAVDTNTQSQANSAWSLHTAAYTQGQGEATLINGIWSLVSNNLTDFGIFPTEYALNGAGGNTVASPAIGGIFAPLALTVQNVSITVPSPSSTGSPPPSPRVPTDAIVGGAVGGVAVICGLVLAVVYYRTRHSIRRSVEEQEKAQHDLADPEPFAFQTTPSELPRIDTTGFPRGVPATTQPPPPGSSDPPPVPSKLREHLLLSQQYQSTTASNPGPSPPGFTSSTSPGSSRNLPTEAFSTASPLSPQDVEELRNEVENLRRVIMMQAVQAERFDPPPGYDSAAPSVLQGHTDT